MAIVDTAFAAAVFPGEEAIGQRLHLDSTDEPVEVVGIAGVVRHWSLDERETGHARYQVYVPHAQLPDRLTPLASRMFSVVVRSSRPTGDVLAALRARLREFDSGHVMVNETALDAGIARSLASRRFSLVLLGAFAVGALALSVVAIGGFASLLASDRVREIGIRRALGAHHHDIIHAVLGPVGQAVAMGAVLGVLVSLALARLVAGMLYQVSVVDPVTLTLVTMVLGVTALAASYGPTRRALRVDPVVALRQE